MPDGRIQARPSVDTFSAFPTTTVAHNGITAKRVIVPECGMTPPHRATDGSQVHRERVTAHPDRLVTLDSRLEIEPVVCEESGKMRWSPKFGHRTASVTPF